MFCSKCGTQLNEDAKFCNNCGERIITNSTQNNETFQNNTTNVENTESNKQTFIEKISSKLKGLQKDAELSPEEQKELLDNHNKYLAAFFHLKEPPTNDELKALKEENEKLKLCEEQGLVSLLLNKTKGISGPDLKVVLSCLLLVPYAYLFYVGAKKMAVLFFIVSSALIFMIIAIKSIIPIPFFIEFIIAYIWLVVMYINLIDKSLYLAFKERMKKVENEKSEKEKLAKFKSLCPNIDISKKLYIISFICSILIWVIASFTFSTSGKYTNIVKKGAFSSYPNITVGELVKGAIKNPKWKQLMAKDGKNYVNVSGDMHGTKLKVLIQFRINDENTGAWEVNACEIDGEPISIYGLVNDLYELYMANK